MAEAATVLGLIHLISLLPTTPPGDVGVRANVDHLVDLLVEDLVNDGTALRQEVPAVLAALSDEGVLQQDGDEYRLQTVAGRAWDEAYRRHSAQLTDSEIAERKTRLRVFMRDSPRRRRAPRRPRHRPGRARCARRGRTRAARGSSRRSTSGPCSRSTGRTCRSRSSRSARS